MSNKKETVLAIEGMTCTACVRHVENALRELDGIDEVEVRLRDGRVRIEHDALSPTIEEMIEALAEAGYGSRERSS